MTVALALFRILVVAGAPLAWRKAGGSRRAALGLLVAGIASLGIVSLMAWIYLGVRRWPVEEESEQSRDEIRRLVREMRDRDLALPLRINSPELTGALAAEGLPRPANPFMGMAGAIVPWAVVCYRAGLGMSVSLAPLYGAAGLAAALGYAHLAGASWLAGTLESALAVTAVAAMLWMAWWIAVASLARWPLAESLAARETLLANLRYMIWEKGYRRAS